MLRDILLYAGSIVVAGWGIAHFFPTRSVIRSFGPISDDSRKILAMEWIMEGLTLCFIGLLVIIVNLLASAQDYIPVVVYQLSGFMLLAMAAVSVRTGARTAVLPMRLCPIIFTTVAAGYFLASVL